MPAALVQSVTKFRQNVQVVVVTDMGLPESVKLDEACRQQGVAFIRAETRGVFGSVFCDFGNAFTVVDTDGAPPPKRFRQGNHVDS